MLKIAICDDQPQELAKFENMLNSYARDRNLSFSVTQFLNASDLVDVYDEHQAAFDLILLDILMPVMNGISAAEKIHQSSPEVPVIFLTSSRDYAVESYDVRAYGYLVKPVQPEKLHAYLDRLLADMKQPRIALQVQGFRQYFFNKDLMYFESRDHRTWLHHRDGRELRCAENLTVLTELLSSDPSFYRCHKGYLVNMDYILQADEVFLLMDGSRVPYRVREKKHVLDHYYRYFLEKNL